MTKLQPPTKAEKPQQSAAVALPKQQQQPAKAELQSRAAPVKEPSRLQKESKQDVQVTIPANASLVPAAKASCSMLLVLFGCMRSVKESQVRLMVAADENDSC